MPKAKQVKEEKPKEDPTKTKAYVALGDFVHAGKAYVAKAELELLPRQAVWLNVKLK